MRESEIVGKTQRAVSDQLASIPGLRRLGFEGCRTVASLRNEGLDGVPEEPGVYLIIRTNAVPPRFRKVGTGGHFKRKNPNVPLSRLEEEWVEGALVLYIGQAGSKSKGTLRNRIDLLIKFGDRKPVGHHGGRLVWQLADADELKICWKTVLNEDPRNVESRLIQDFKTLHGDRRPFANLRD